jgi:transcriptional regulator GlxA family with amidase domain
MHRTQPRIDRTVNVIRRAAGHDHHIGAGDLIEGVCCNDRQIVGVVHNRTLLRSDPDGTVPRHFGEHLIGTDDIEGRETRIESEGDLHASIVFEKLDVCNDKILTNSAINGKTGWMPKEVRIAVRDEVREFVRDVVVVVFPGVQLLDAVGTIDVFDAANRVLGEQRYRIVVASVAGGVINSSSGVGIATTKLSLVRSVDTVVVVGGFGTNDALKDESLLKSLRRLTGRASRVASVCTGAFLLAELGLLDGRAATTHWYWADRFAQQYPSVDVDPSPIFIRSDHIWTSAGVTSGIDLALALVAEDHDAKLAAQIARHLVVYVQRPGGQSQFAGPERAVAASAPMGPEWQQLVGWITRHLDHNLSVPALAERMHLSERQFARRCNEVLGAPPGALVESIRLQGACTMLERTNRSLPDIAIRCGFGTIETMHRVFRRRLNTTPLAHRKHFAAA